MSVGGATPPLDAGGRLLRHLPFRADPNLRLIAGLEKLSQDGHLRHDDPDQNADAGGDPGDGDRRS